MNLDDLIIKLGPFATEDGVPPELADLGAAQMDELREELIELRRLRAITYEEWRVTGHPGESYPLYVFTWSPSRGDDDPEGAARGFIKLVESHERWMTGPHLHKRAVTMTDWEDA